MNQPLYTPDILRLAASVPPFEPLPDATGSAEKRSTTCGSTIRADVRTDADGRVTALAQKVIACAFGQASAALTQQAAPGRTAADLQALRASLHAWLTGAAENPGPFAPLAPARDKSARHSAMLLPLDAIIAAVEQATHRVSLDYARDERS